MTEPIRFKRFVIEYREPDVAEMLQCCSTFRATCQDCGEHVDALVEWRALTGAIDEVVILTAFRGKLGLHEQRHAEARDSASM